MKDPHTIKLIAPSVISKLKDPRVIRMSGMLALCCVCFLSGRASAYNPQILNSLNRSRDALLTQRSHLQQAADDTRARIGELQTKLDSINSYLSDTDKAIRDVEAALARAD
ncbi:MAG TPA: hypothetical protein V6C76_05110 [Drouetiella sp.]